MWKWNSQGDPSLGDGVDINVWMVKKAIHEEKDISPTELWANK
jgi:hypothetical protein